MYNYYEAMKNDVLQAIRDNYDVSDFADRDELEQQLNDDLWVDDSVTGNASGSYTFCRNTAREYVTENADLVREMIAEFCIEAETVVDHFMSEDWEWFDVSIRCYLLGSAISAALDEIPEEAYSAEMEAEEEAEEAEEEKVAI